MQPGSEGGGQTRAGSHGATLVVGEAVGHLGRQNCILGQRLPEQSQVLAALWGWALPGGNPSPAQTQPQAAPPSLAW